MKKIVFTLILIAGALSITLIYSCKKSDSTTTTPAPSGPTLDANDQTSSDDENMYKGQNNQVNSDINSDIETNHSNIARMGQGSQKLLSSGCGDFTVDVTHADTLIYNFDSLGCNGYTRTGTIIVSLSGASYWHDAGAVLTFNFVNFKVIRSYDNKSITFNGTKTLKDNNGFNWLSFLGGQDTIKYTERAYNMQVAFSGGLHAVWNSACVSQWYLKGVVLYFTCNGDTSFGGYNNVSEWGTDRFNQSFTVYYNSPLVCNSFCSYGYSEPYSGVIVFVVNNSTLTLSLGVNENGTPYTGNLCPYGYEIAWVLPNSTGSIVLPYL